MCRSGAATVVQGRILVPLGDAVPSAADHGPLTIIRAGNNGLAQEFREIWAYRELLQFLVWRSVKVRYKQTAVGAVWAIAQPAALGVIFSVFFGRYARLPSDGLPHMVFFMCSVLPWTYFSTALLTTTSSLVDHQNLLTKVYFPRILLPLSTVLVGLVDFAIALVGLAATLVSYAVPLRSTIWLAPVAMAVAVIGALGAGLWLSAANAYYRDVRHAVPFLVQLLMFASPVVYPASVVPAQWRFVFGLNPITGVIETFRWSLTGAGEPPGVVLLTGFAVSVALVASGLMFFRRVEQTLADVV